MGLCDGNVAVVTGGNSGIGEGLARMLYAEGADVALVARREAALERAASALRQETREGGRVLCLATDITQAAAVERMAAAVRHEFGRVDILVNCAGLGVWRTVDAMTPEEWQTVMETNVTGTFLVTRAFLGDMIRRRSGHIINMSSVAGKLGFATGAAYCASKWAVIGFTRALAAEARPHGIRVDVLCPGTVRTPFLHSPAASPVELEVEDVVAAARYLLTLPRQVRVEDLVLHPA
jgi:NAD(P)-dependent dehydrogenase (short-subunit alcohol dehydrogenase family)